MSEAGKSFQVSFPNSSSLWVDYLASAGSITNNIITELNQSFTINIPEPDGFFAVNIGAIASDSLTSNKIIYMNLISDLSGFNNGTANIDERKKLIESQIGSISSLTTKESVYGNILNGALQESLKNMGFIDADDSYGVKEKYKIKLFHNLYSGKDTAKFNIIIEALESGTILGKDDVVKNNILSLIKNIVVGKYPNELKALGPSKNGI